MIKALIKSEPYREFTLDHHVNMMIDYLKKMVHFLIIAKT